MLLPELERLDVSRWTIKKFLEDSTPSTLIDPALSKLKFLHLPVHKNNKGTSLSGLRLIAESFPNLVSFRSRIVTDDDDIPVSDPSKPAAHVLSHGLEILSVGNTSRHLEPEKVLDIARHIFALFPNLKEIQTHEGQNEVQWNYIHSLVRIFQGVCLDQAARLTK